MNNFLKTFLICFTLSLKMFGFNIKTNLTYINNEITKKTLVQCSTSETSCLDICSNQNQCILSEPVCIDCLGKKEHTFNIIFNDKIEKYYAKSENELPQNLVNYFLKNESYLLLEYDSFLNYMTPESNNLHLAQMQKICSNQETNNLLIVSLDKSSLSNPHLVGIICQNDLSKKSTIYALAPLYNPNEIQSYWENLWKFITEPLERLTLKFDTQLK